MELVFERAAEQVQAQETEPLEPDLAMVKVQTRALSGHVFRLLLSFYLTCILYFYL